ncbi:hypothetical protein ACS0TY_027254 [Phlomoides rotata]
MIPKKRSPVIHKKRPLPSSTFGWLQICPFSSGSAQSRKIFHFLFAGFAVVSLSFVRSPTPLSKKMKRSYEESLASRTNVMYYSWECHLGFSYSHAPFHLQIERSTQLMQLIPAGSHY